jgi:hypothetical protein
MYFLPKMNIYGNEYFRLNSAFLEFHLRYRGVKNGRSTAVRQNNPDPISAGAKMPKIETIAAWDGKDGELPPEEDIDLSDVDLDKDEL